MTIRPQYCCRLIRIGRYLQTQLMPTCCADKGWFVSAFLQYTHNIPYYTYCGEIVAINRQFVFFTGRCGISRMTVRPAHNDTLYVRLPKFATACYFRFSTTSRAQCTLAAIICSTCQTLIIRFRDSDILANRLQHRRRRLTLVTSENTIIFGK